MKIAAFIIAALVMATFFMKPRRRNKPPDKTISYRGTRKSKEDWDKWYHDIMNDKN